MFTTHVMKDSFLINGTTALKHAQEKVEGGIINKEDGIHEEGLSDTTVNDSSYCAPMKIELICLCTGSSKL